MPASESVKAAAFEAGADPALVIGPDGLLRVANEAAEILFGQGLGVLSRARLCDALAPSDGIVQLIDRAVESGAHARERDVEVALLGQAAFHADAVAAPLPDGAVLLTLHPLPAGLGRRSSDVGGLRSIGGFGRMLAHEIKNPLAGIRGSRTAAEVGRQGRGRAPGGADRRRN